MMNSQSPWAIILAGGEGSRVRSFGVDDDGVAVPKQYWRLGDQRTLLRRTVDRALRLAPRERTLAVVAQAHDRWWKDELADLPSKNVLVQPDNRGTGSGILLPLMRILREDPRAPVALFPCDHHVEREETLHEATVDGSRLARRRRELGVLLGMTPEGEDTEYGWIVPGEPVAEAPARKVDSFVEKPDRTTATRLAERGGLVNSMIFVASAETLLRFFQRTVPAVAGEFLDWQASPRIAGRSSVEDLYRSLPSCDFSRHVLQGVPDRLSVLPVPPCGWTDIGTPDRLRPFLED